MNNPHDGYKTECKLFSFGFESQEAKSKLQIVFLTLKRLECF
jgi:hypothetical protein